LFIYSNSLTWESEAAVHTVPERDEFNPHSYFLYLALQVTLLKRIPFIDCTLTTCIM